jgi:uncharacterized protein
MGHSFPAPVRRGAPGGPSRSDRADAAVWDSHVPVHGFGGSTRLSEEHPDVMRGARVLAGCERGLSALGPAAMLAHYGWRVPLLGGKSMTEHPNAKLIRHGYDAFAHGDLEALREFMAPDVVWHEPGRGPLAGDHKGPEGVLALLGELRARSCGTFAIEIVDLLANAERAVDPRRNCPPRPSSTRHGERGRVRDPSGQDHRGHRLPRRHLPLRSILGLVTLRSRTPKDPAPHDAVAVDEQTRMHGREGR